jgi:prepilin-type N-terminal cleavage/methylation domain-containing protein
MMGNPTDPASGFSMLELLVALSVGLVFALAGWSFQQTQARELGDQAAALDATDRIRSTMDFMAREIRKAGYDPKMTALIVPGSKGVSEARSDRLAVQWDKSENGAIEPDATDPNPESVLYSYDSTDSQILRTVNGAAQTLIRNVPSGGLVFEYFDILGNQLTPITVVGQSSPLLDAVQRDLIAFVRVRLQVQAVGTTRPTTLKQTARVTVRNRIIDKL